MKRHIKGFSLIEMSIALILFAILGVAMLNLQVRQSRRDSARAQADQLLQLRDALQSYVDTYRSAILANTSIPFTVGSGSVNNTQTLLPTVSGLIGLGLLPTTFKNTASLNNAGYVMSAVQFVPAGCITSNPKSCRIGGHVRLANPLLLRDVVTEVNAGRFDGDLAFDALDVLGGNGFVSLTKGGNYTAANGSFTLTNDAAYLGVSKPAGIIGIQFYGSSNASSAVAYSDYCPGDTISIGNGKIGGSSPFNYAGTVAFSTTSYTGSTPGVTVVGSVTSAGKTCSGNTAYQYPDTPVNMMGVAAGYSTTGANNTGVLRITCTMNAAGLAVPRFTIFSC